MSDEIKLDLSLQEGLELLGGLLTDLLQKRHDEMMPWIARAKSARDEGREDVSKEFSRRASEAMHRYDADENMLRGQISDITSRIRIEHFITENPATLAKLKVDTN